MTESRNEQEEAKQLYQEEQVALEAGAIEAEQDEYTDFAAQNAEVQDESDIWQAGAKPDQEENSADMALGNDELNTDGEIEANPVTSGSAYEEEYAAEVAEPASEVQDEAPQNLETDTAAGEAWPSPASDAAAQDEEYAAEIATPDTGLSQLQDRDRADTTEVTEQDREESGTTLGWTAFTLAVASLFLWPVLLGPTSAVLGFYAYSQGRRALGTWAITLGLIAFISSFLFRVYR